MVNSSMNTDLDREMQRQKTIMVWFIVIFFILLNIFLISIGVLTDFGATRITEISEIVFWYNLFSFGIVGTYFGIDLISYFRERNFLASQSRKPD